MNLKIKKLYTDSKVPSFAHSYDAGMDLFSIEDVFVKGGDIVKIKTGVAFEIEDGYVGLIWDKSSVGSRGLKTLGGVIDSGYRGEVIVVMKNLGEDYEFKKGDKIAQILIQKVEHPNIEEVNELSSTVRGEGGFGSTGK